MSKEEFVKQLELGLSHNEFCKELDMQLLNGHGEGCSYANALSWTEAAWKYKEREISKLVEALEFYASLNEQINEQGECVPLWHDKYGNRARQALANYNGSKQEVSNEDREEC